MFLFLSACNAIIWGAIVAGSLAFRWVPALVVAAVAGFAWPFFVHATSDASSQIQEVFVAVFVPISSLPFVGLGWLLGFGADWAWRRGYGRAVTPADASDGAGG